MPSGLELGVKEWFGIVAVILAIVNYLPYLIGSLTGNIKPHVFTWTVWCVLTSIAFLAQLENGGGIGAWATGTTAIILFLICCAALKNGLTYVRVFDWIALAGAGVAVMLWLVTDNAFWSVILVSLIHSLCFLPTFRSGFQNPAGQSVLAFILTILKYGSAIIAMQAYSVETILFPATIMTTSGIFISMMFIRRSNVQAHART